MGDRLPTRALVIGKLSCGRRSPTAAWRPIPIQTQKLQGRASPAERGPATRAPRIVPCPGMSRKRKFPQAHRRIDSLSLK